MNNYINNIYSIITFNVHNFYNSEMINTFSEISKIIKKYDIIALQEVYDEQKLFLITKEYNFVYNKGTLIMTKFPIQIVNKNTSCPSTICIITLPDGVNIFVTNIHLNYIDESIRIEEINEIQYIIDDYTDYYPSILLGDFNALTKNDYTEKEWNQITKIRRLGGWELPVHILTDRLLEKWNDTGKKNKKPTSRYDTRIDYIYTKNINSIFYDIVETIHTISDHNLVSIFFHT